MSATISPVITSYQTLSTYVRLGKEVSAFESMAPLPGDESQQLSQKKSELISLFVLT